MNGLLKELTLLKLEGHAYPVEQCENLIEVINMTLEGLRED